MSDTMMFDIARMPYEMAMSDEMSRRQFYANTQRLAAALEALREEVERLASEVRSLRQQYDERTVYMVVHRGTALACSDSMRSAYSDEHRRAERLAEALRNSADALERLAFAIPAPNVHTPQLATLAIAMRNAAIQRTDAALDQARGKGVADES